VPRAYSEDLRQRIVADTGRGLSIRAIADKYSVSPSFVSKISSLWRHSGSVRAKRIGGYKRHALAAHAEAVRRKLNECRDMTLHELRDWVEESCGVRVHVSSIDRFVRALGYSYKKNVAGQRTRAC
jgi:transposase